MQYLRNREDINLKLLWHVELNQKKLSVFRLLIGRISKISGPAKGVNLKHPGKVRGF